MKERIRKLIHELNYKNQKEFANKIGISESTISQFKKGTKGLGNKFWEGLARVHPEINTEWIKTGTGNIRVGDIMMQGSLPFSNNEVAENGGLSKHRNQKMQIQDLHKEVSDCKQAGNKSIEKIIVLYSDNTFKLYTPD